MKIPRHRGEMSREEKREHNRKRELRRRATPERRKKDNKRKSLKRKYYLLSPENKKKVNCRSRTNRAIKKGTMLKEPCEICGTDVQIEAHHSDYNDWRNVNWLCKMHHVAYHVEVERLKREVQDESIFSNLLPH
jgi:hypothetical protein